jgi:hypothetical protein
MGFSGDFDVIPYPPRHERVALDWAGTQINLGNALAALAKRQNKAQRMEEGLTCVRSAVEVYPIAQRRVTEMQAELVELQR